MVEAATNAQIKEIFERNERTVRSDRRKKTVGKAELWVTELDALLERIRTAEADKARLSEALRGTTASLVAAVSLLKRGSKKAAPSNKMFDQMILDYSKSIEEARAALAGSDSGWRAMAKPLDAWHEDDGFVTWWTWRDGQWLGEPSYIGSPLCSDWPGYHTHWTKHPDFPAAPQQGGE